MNTIARILVLLPAVSVIAAPPRIDAVRSSSAPYISGDSFRAIAHHVFDETDMRLDPATVKEKDIIFVKTDYLEQFFTQIHPNIQAQYLLISHNADHPAPGAYVHYLDDPKIIAWFGQNPTIMGHPKFRAIPIGIANRMWSHGNPATVDKARSLASGMQKKHLLGMNFVVSTHQDVRKPVYDFFVKQPFCTQLYYPDHFQYLLAMGTARFVLSPRGNGLDCHRTWEALLMGAVPVMTHSMMDECLEGLPVVLVDDWNQVTPEFLEQESQRIIRDAETMHHEKMFFDYWRDLINSYRY